MRTCTQIGGDPRGLTFLCDFGFANAHSGGLTQTPASYALLPRCAADVPVTLEIWPHPITPGIYGMHPSRRRALASAGALSVPF
jgi:hypothetical protein